MHNLGFSYSGLGWKLSWFEVMAGIMIVGDVLKKSGTIMLVFSTYRNLYGMVIVRYLLLIL